MLDQTRYEEDVVVDDDVMDQDDQYEAEFEDSSQAEVEFDDDSSEQEVFYDEDGNRVDADGNLLEDEEEDDGQPSEFMVAMAAAMPWLISLLVHVGLFLGLIFWVLFKAKTKKIVPPAVAAPSMKQTETPGGSFSNSATTATSKALTPPTTPKPSRSQSTNTNLTTEETNAITTDGGPGGNPAGGGDKGLNRPGGGGGGPKSRFMGTAGGNCKNAIYLIDRSGSMNMTLPVVKRELKKSISKLTRSQKFNVFFFSDGKPEKIWKRKLKSAHSGNKRKANRFLNKVQAGSSTDPARALSEAFKIFGKGNYRGGTVVYLLTDAAFNDPDKVIDLVKKLRATRKGKTIMINTILFSSEEDPDGRKVLTEISKLTGGQYKFKKVEDDDED